MKGRRRRQGGRTFSGGGASGSGSGSGSGLPSSSSCGSGVGTLGLSGGIGAFGMCPTAREANGALSQSEAARQRAITRVLLQPIGGAHCAGEAQRDGGQDDGTNP